MCMVCEHYEAKTLTAEEAFSNLDELVRCGDISQEHGIHVVSMVLLNEMEDIEDDLEINFDDMFV